MTDNPNRAGLDDLLLKLEREWERAGDPGIIDRLAEENPERADDLFDYFAFLVDADSGLLNDAEDDARMAGFVARWLESEGLSMARTIASETRRRGSGTTQAGTPTVDLPNGRSAGVLPQTGELGLGRMSLSGFLSRATGRKPSEVIAALGVPPGLMAALSAHHESIPLPVREALAERAQRSLGVDRDRVLDCLRSAPNLPVAASRETPYENKRLAWSEVVRMAGMSADEERYWLSVGQV